MTTDKQTKANRANAQSSSGPRSAAGKERSRLNARVHGLNQSINTRTCPEASILQALFEDDGMAPDEALKFAEAHIARARVRAARHKAWCGMYDNAAVDSEQRSGLHDVPPELLATVNEQTAGNDWQRFLPFLFEKPFLGDQELRNQAAIKFLDKQRRLNRYDVRAVSQLSKLYKKAYKGTVNF